MITLVGFVLILCFGFVLLFGAPYVPTLKKQSRLALETINLRPGQTLLELGCGDGRMLKAAAEVGIHGVGIELNPILVLVARARTWRYRKHVRILWGNLWHTRKWPAETDGIFVFILQKEMTKLDAAIAQWHTHPIKLVSFAFPIPDKKPLVQHSKGVYLYEY